MPILALLIALVNSLPALAVQPADLHYVLIAGYRNEEIPGYLSQNARELWNSGAGVVNEIRPPSETAVIANLPALQAELRRLYEAGARRPLVLIAHSKGGLETLNALLRGEASLGGAVHRVFLVQSPLRGSPYTDYLLGLSSGFAWNPAYWYYRAHYQGFVSMSTVQVAWDLAESARLAGPAWLRTVGARIRYVRSRQAATRVSPSLQEYLPVVSVWGENDGLVPTDRQHLEALGGVAPFGRDLGILNDSDHLELVVAGEHPSPARLEKIRAFTKRILELSLEP